MDKKKIALMVFFIIISYIHTYSQNMLVKKIEWKSLDTIEQLVFYDTTQLIEWCKNQLPFSSLYTQKVTVNKKDLLLVVVTGCSGIPCNNIYVYNEVKGSWICLAVGKTRQKNKINIVIDDFKQIVVFKAQNSDIGYLPSLH